MDDFLQTAESSIITDSTDQLLHTLKYLGFELNFEKSQLQPTQTINYIGYTITSTECMVAGAQIKHVFNLKRSIKRALDTKAITYHNLAQICGQCIFVAWAVSLTRIFLRHWYRLLGSRVKWSDLVELNAEIIKEFKWWLDSYPLEWKQNMYRIYTSIDSDGRKSSRLGPRYTKIRLHRATGTWECPAYPQTREKWWLY